MNPSDNVGETSEKVPKKNKLGLKNPFTKPAKLTKMESVSPKDDADVKVEEKKNLSRNKTEELEISLERDETGQDVEVKSIKTPPKEKKKLFRKEKKSSSLDSGTPKKERKTSVEDRPEKMKTKIKAASLVRRLSLGAIGVKYKKTTHSTDGADYDDVSPESTSSGATPTSIKRHTPEGEDISRRSISEISLTDIDETDDSLSERSKNSQDNQKPAAEKTSEGDVTFELYKPKPQNVIAQLKTDFLNEAPPQIVEPVQVVGESVTTTTLPFAVSSWRPTEPIKRPIESPSPEDSIRRRIAWVAQPTVYTSVDNEEVLEEKTTTKSDKLSIKSFKDNETIEQTFDVEITEHRKLTVTKPHDKRVGRESPLPNIEEDRTESFEQLEDSEDINLQPESTAMPPFGDFIADNLADTTNLAQSMERREYLYKILVIGELGTGKTSIIKRYVHQFFSQHYRATIGVDFALKVINWDPTTIIRLQLWDIAGQERFGNMTRVYYKEAVGAFIVYDVTRLSTFEAVQKWKADLDSKVQLPDGSSIPCVLLANKCDQTKDTVNSASKMDDFCKEKGFTGWFETSAKENINIEEAAKSLVNKILQNDKLNNQDNADSDRIAIDGRNGNPEGLNTSSSSCAC